jgi:hypothetical protein
MHSTINKQAMTLSLPHTLLGVFFLSPLVVNANSRGIAYPNFRYVQYNTLSAETVALATELGYDAANWNTPGTNPTEGIAYANLGAAQQTILDLGFDSQQWDCYVNHHLDNFDYWDEIQDNDVKGYLMGIGHTQDNWNSGSPPESSYKDWVELTTEEQASAVELCYFQETWDLKSMVDWVPIPPEFVPSAAPSSAPSSAPSAAPSAAPSFVEDSSGAANEQTQQESAAPEGYRFLVSTVSVFLSLYLHL